MKLNIRGDKLVVTDAIKAYIEDKTKRLEKYFDNNDIEAKIIVKVANNKEIIEITIPTNKYTLRAEEKNDDLYAAIDLVTDKIERQIRKNKTKINKIEKDAAKKLNLVLEEISDEIEENDKIVRRKELNTKPMDEEEAMLQMEMLGHDFFIYKDRDTKRICILYKRKDGNYGLIETK